MINSIPAYYLSYYHDTLRTIINLDAIPRDKIKAYFLNKFKIAVDDDNFIATLSVVGVIFFAIILLFGLVTLVSLAVAKRYPKVN